MLSRHRRESREKIVDRFAGLEVVEEGLHGNSRPMEHNSAAHHVGATRDNRLLHVERLHLDLIDMQRHEMLAERCRVCSTPRRTRYALHRNRGHAAERL
jgi:hypothetical protein